MSYIAVPSVLRKRALTAAVLKYADEAFHRFTCQSFFGDAQVYSEEEIEYDILQHMRRLPEFHASPAAADRKSFHQVGKDRARMLYQALSFVLRTNELAKFADVGESRDQPLMVQDALAKRDRVINRELQTRVLAILRNREFLASQILSTGSASVTVDGDTQTINYGAATKTASSTWATAATNILEEFDGWMSDFVELSGGPPTDICVSHRFVSSYLAVNDDLRTYHIRNLEPLTTVFARATGLPEGIRWHYITDRYLNGSDTATQFWATDKMTFLRNDPGSFEAATCRTLDNDMNGGLFSYTIEHENPREIEVVVTDNYLPIIKDSTKIQIHDLVP